MNDIHNQWVETINAYAYELPLSESDTFSQFCLDECSDVQLEIPYCQVSTMAAILLLGSAFDSK